MKKEHKVWWEALADQYEEWADKPPILTRLGVEDFTCFALDDIRGFTGLSCEWRVSIRELFKLSGYSDLDYPAGDIYDDNRATKREAFCQDMADTIRENIQ